MPETTVQLQPSTVSVESDGGLNRRIYRVMLASTVLASGIAVFIAPWRVVTGLILGGVLALFSHHWLQNSAAAAISLSMGGGKPKLKLLQFLLRYLVVAAVVILTYQLNLISLVAVFFGLSTFVVALFAEAFRAFYFAIIQREEIS